ncbi:MAG: hypothetical protein H0U94_00480 [Acidobacteria bacterium]|nr:hypothetical protein [Acidobacteriota bacterium]
MKRREFLANVAIAPALLTVQHEPDEAGFTPLFGGSSLDRPPVRDLTAAGPIGLQAPSAGRWTQFEQIRVRRI